MNNVTIRPIRKIDRIAIERFLGQLSEFKKAEIECALELIQSAIKNNNSDEDYAVLCAETSEGGVIGFICYGKTPLSKSVYDLYWIAIDPRYHRCGIGRKLLYHLEEMLKEQNARLVVAETSSLPVYQKARSFYEKEGFRNESCIKDFYAPGDDRLIYCKRY